MDLGEREREGRWLRGGGVRDWRCDGSEGLFKSWVEELNFGRAPPALAL